MTLFATGGRCRSCPRTSLGADEEHRPLHLLEEPHRLGQAIIEVVQTYAGGPISQVNSIIWPNPEFDNDLTAYGPGVNALVERYLDQMMGELCALDAPDGGSLLGATDIVVPHQANKSMVAKSATAAGLDGEHLSSTSKRSGTSPPPASRSRSTTPSERARSTTRCARSRPRSAPARWAATR